MRGGVLGQRFLLGSSNTFPQESGFVKQFRNVWRNDVFYFFTFRNVPRRIINDSLSLCNYDTLSNTEQRQSLFTSNRY